jgi:hypothetical protein
MVAQSLSQLPDMFGPEKLHSSFSEAKPSPLLLFTSERLIKMLVETIAFEVRDFVTGEFEEFRVENTEENYEMIAGNSQTRQIQFEKVFDLQWPKLKRTPAFMIDPRIIAAVIIENTKEMADA